MVRSRWKVHRGITGGLGHSVFQVTATGQTISGAVAPPLTQRSWGPVAEGSERPGAVGTSTQCVWSEAKDNTQDTPIHPGPPAPAADRWKPADRMDWLVWGFGGLICPVVGWSEVGRFGPWGSRRLTSPLILSVARARGAGRQAA